MPARYPLPRDERTFSSTRGEQSKHAADRGRARRVTRSLVPLAHAARAPRCADEQHQRDPARPRRRERRTSAPNACSAPRALPRSSRRRTPATFPPRAGVMEMTAIAPWLTVAVMGASLVGSAIIRALYLNWLERVAAYAHLRELDGDRSPSPSTPRLISVLRPDTVRTLEKPLSLLSALRATDFNAASFHESDEKREALHVEYCRAVLMALNGATWGWLAVDGRAIDARVARARAKVESHGQ